MGLFRSCCPQRNHQFIEISPSRNLWRIFTARELIASLSLRKLKFKTEMFLRTCILKFFLFGFWQLKKSVGVTRLLHFKVINLSLEFVHYFYNI